MKLFLDDVRQPKDCLGYMYHRIGALNPIYLEEWTVVKNYTDFIKALQDAHNDNIEISHISFDHDLADNHYEIMQDYTKYYDTERDHDQYTGYDCAKFLKEMYERQSKELPVMFVHSMNPVGTENIINLFKS